MISRLKRWVGAAAGCTAAAALATVVLRATIADRTPLSAWIFYFVPLPLSALALVGAALLFAAATQPRPAIVAGFAAVSLYGFWTFAHTFHARDERCDDALPSDLRVVSWNVNHLRRGMDAVAERLETTDADIIGLVEGSDPSAKHLAFWRSRFPGHTVILPGGGLVLIVRGNVVTSGMRELIGISRLLVADVEIDGAPLRLALADLDASPRFDKKTLVERTFDAAGGDDTRPTIVMGDFNTPIDSLWFRAVRERYVHAFEKAGTGLLATWPAERPILAIDHIWAGPGLTATCARLEATPLSDHSMFRAVFRRDAIRATTAPPL
jgi:endonuclease/exonuclease/phosphatase (EEP) superfamily protein YafD